MIRKHPEYRKKEKWRGKVENVTISMTRFALKFCIDPNRNFKKIDFFTVATVGSYSRTSDIFVSDVI